MVSSFEKDNQGYKFCQLGYYLKIGSYVIMDHDWFNLYSSWKDPELVNHISVSMTPLLSVCIATSFVHDVDCDWSTSKRESLVRLGAYGHG